MEVASRKPIPDEIKNVQSLSMWLDMSARRMQTGSTATMIFGVHFLAAVTPFSRRRSVSSIPVMTGICQSVRWAGT
jgi:hypothetical protein